MARLTVIGALAMDRPVRLDGPLAPGARLHGATLHASLSGRLGGGGGNSGVALLKAGHQVSIVGMVAEDPEGDEVLTVAHEAGLDVENVARRPGVTRKTLIFVDPNGERAVIGLDFDRASFVMPELPPPSAATPPDALFIRAAYPGAAAWAQACPGPVIVHYPSPTYAGLADVVVCSADDMDAEFLADPYGVARARLGERVAWAVVTHGKAGATAHGSQGSVTASPPAATVVDSTGAGDIFAAGLMDALASGADMEAALAHACVWGAGAVSVDGSAPVDASPTLFPAFRPAAS